MCKYLNSPLIDIKIGDKLDCFVAYKATYWKHTMVYNILSIGVRSNDLSPLNELCNLSNNNKMIHNLIMSD
uniref:Tudor domain-containing protein n=1 Tax=Schistosoma mansoni TaxID=6183 RepID=A0A5K4F9I3_SCHMA